MNEVVKVFQKLSFVVFVIITFGMILIACGGNGGDDDGEITGNVSSAAVANIARDGENLSGINVCAFGECDITDDSGNFKFFIDPSLFPGGAVTFTLDGNGFNSEVVVNDVVASPEILEINFTFNSSSSATYVILQNVAIDSNDGTSDTPDSTPTVGDVGTPIADATVTPDTDLACSLLSGSYSGNGGCRINSLTVSSNTGSGGSVTFAPFGSNSSASFGGSESSITSTSSDLTLFDLPGHSCTITCAEGGGSFTLTCSDGTNSCSETFS